MQEMHFLVLTVIYILRSISNYLILPTGNRPLFKGCAIKRQETELMVSMFSVWFLSTITQLIHTQPSLSALVKQASAEWNWSVVLVLVLVDDFIPCSSCSTRGNSWLLPFRAGLRGDAGAQAGALQGGVPAGGPLLGGRVPPQGDPPLGLGWGPAPGGPGVLHPDQLGGDLRPRDPGARRSPAVQSDMRSGAQSHPGAAAGLLWVLIHHWLAL